MFLIVRERHYKYVRQNELSSTWLVRLHYELTCSLIYTHTHTETIVDMYVHTGEYTYLSFLALSLRGSRSSNTLTARSTPVSESWFLVPFSTKRNWGFLEKWLIPGLGQIKYNMSPGTLWCQKSRKCSKNKLKKDGSMSKEHRSNLINKIQPNKYMTQNKINIHHSMLI